MPPSLSSWPVGSLPGTQRRNDVNTDAQMHADVAAERSQTGRRRENIRRELERTVDLEANRIQIETSQA
jgi:hypothetical protein